MMKYIVIFFAAFFVSLAGSAQQDAMNTQYVVNKLFVNPAYAGYKEAPSIVAIQRNQWLGFKGAPRTSILSFDTPAKKGNLAYGGTVFYDKVGPASKLGLSADVAYRLRLTNRATLAFGAKATMEIYQANLTDLNLSSEYYGTQDEAFMNNTKGVVLPNIGFGLYYFKKDHFISLSMPKMVLNKLERRGSEQYTLLRGRQIPSFILMGGKIFKVNKQIKVQPTVVLRAVWGAPVSLGLFANAIIMDQITAGLFYHVGENVGLLFQWQLDRHLKLGYSVDVPVNALIRTNFGSHELMLQYTIATKRKRIVYPRYF